MPASKSRSESGNHVGQPGGNVVDVDDAAVVVVALRDIEVDDAAVAVVDVAGCVVDAAGTRDVDVRGVLVGTLVRARMVVCGTGRVDVGDSTGTTPRVAGAVAGRTST